MKSTVFMLAFMALLASSALASGLEITEIDVHVNYDEAYTYRLEDRDRKDSTTVPVTNNTKIDADILPGSNVTFTVRVENTLQVEDLDLRGVVVTINIEDIDDGGDLDEKSIDFDLEPGNDNRVDVKFGIPLDVDDGTYNVVIEAEGEDRNETPYETELNLKLEVKKQSHDIRITKILLNPSIVDCDRKATLKAEIANVGSNAEREVALEFKSGNLGINSFDKDIFLESSEEASEEEITHTKTLNIEVPSFFNTGTYPIFINLYWKNFVLFDQKTADLVVRDCGVAKAEIKPVAESGKELVEIIEPEEQAVSEEQITSTQEISDFASTTLVAMLLGGLVIVILVALVVIAYLKRANA